MQATICLIYLLIHLLIKHDFVEQAGRDEQRSVHLFKSYSISHRSQAVAES
jgi:hypothetical protein